MATRYYWSGTPNTQSGEQFRSGLWSIIWTICFSCVDNYFFLRWCTYNIHLPAGYYLNQFSITSARSVLFCCNMINKSVESGLHLFRHQRGTSSFLESNSTLNQRQNSDIVLVIVAEWWIWCDTAVNCEEVHSDQSQPAVPFPSKQHEDQRRKEIQHHHRQCSS